MKRINYKLTVILSLLFIFLATSHITGFNLISSFVNFPSSFYWATSNLVPNYASMSFAPIIFNQLIETILLAISVTTTASIFAFILAIMCANSLLNNTFLRFLVKIFSGILRNIPDAVLAIILMFSFGANIISGFLALFIGTVGILAKAFTEIIEETSKSQIEAVYASGCSTFVLVFRVVLPNTIKDMLSWVLFSIETNVRAATIVGILTGTGIGFLFDIFYRRLDYGSAGLVVLFIIAAVVFIELINEQIRTKLLNYKNNKVLIFVVIALFLISVLSFFTFDFPGINLSQSLSSKLSNFGIMFFGPALFNTDLGSILNSLLITLALGILSTILGFVIAFIITFFCVYSKTLRVLSKVIISIFRAVPAILWVLMFTISMGLGASAAVIGLTIHSAAFLVKTFTESIEENRNTENLESVGASFTSIFFQNIVPNNIRNFTMWTFLRLEINFTNAVIIGAVAGASGIGYNLFLASNFHFNLREVGFITYLILITCSFLEFISFFIKKIIK